jgi:hypothetical protein
MLSLQNIVPGGHARPLANQNLPPQAQLKNPNARLGPQQQVPNLRNRPQVPQPLRVPQQQFPAATKREGLASGFDMGPDVSLIGGRPRSMTDESLAAEVRTKNAYCTSTFKVMHSLL